MPDFDAYIEEAIEVVIKLRDKDVESEHRYIDEGYHSGWIHGLRRAKNLFAVCEQQTRENLLKCPHIESTKFLCGRTANYQINGTVYCQIHARRLLLEKRTVDKVGEKLGKYLREEGNG